MQELTDATWAGTWEKKQYLIQTQRFESVYLQVWSGSAELKQLMKNPTGISYTAKVGLH
jgi:hypothetical protein